MAPPPPRIDGRGQAKKTKGAQINLALLEQGGDFFDLADSERYKLVRANATLRIANRKDVVVAAQQTLLDLVAINPNIVPTVHYDAMAFVPATIERIASENRPTDWAVRRSPVDENVSLESFFSKMVEVARLRGFV